VRAAAKPQAIGPRKARRRRIGLTVEIDRDDIPLLSNNVAINGAEHGEYSVWRAATDALAPAATLAGLFER
jgi:hypothetical protein